MRCFDSIIHSMDMNLNTPGESGHRACVLQSMGLRRVGHKLEIEQQQQHSGVISQYINVTIKLTKYIKINSEWQYTTFLFSHFLHCLHLCCAP